jgi:ubiquinone/menaquinone biosynthesis C-methylase UbiE
MTGISFFYLKNQIFTMSRGISMNNLINPFDEKAKTWDSDPEKAVRARTVADAIAKEVPITPGFSAFEYGCGTGLVSFFLGPSLSRIVMADSSKGMLEVLRRKIAGGNVKNMHPVELDLTRMEAPSEKFNLIYTLLTLHHVPDINRLLVTFYSMLTSPGYLCIADLDKEEGSFHGKSFTGHNGFARVDLQEPAERAGFNDIRFVPVMELTRILDNGEKKVFPMFLMTAEKIR